MTPVAPSTSTVAPGLGRARQPNSSQADRPGFQAAAAAASSRPSGMGKVNSGRAVAYWAMVPPSEPNSTRWPPGRRPAPITPATRGKLAGREVTE